MNRSDTILVLVLLVVMIAMLGYGAVVVINAARDAAAAPCEEPAAGWEPPDLSRCPEDMALWDCIRHAAYRSDI